jgi:hypothetical protein
VRHFYFTGPPVHLQVVILQPGVTKDKVLSSKAGYAEKCSFRVAIVTQQQFRYFLNRPFRVGGSVYVEHRDWLRQLRRRDLIGFNIFPIDEEAALESTKARTLYFHWLSVLSIST